VSDLEALLPRAAELAESAGAFSPKSRDDGGRIPAAGNGDEKAPKRGFKCESEE
jgi:hypothetical protein